MASPKDKELGVRSPFRWRVGLDFENFEGVNKERDPGAIRDTQSQSIINMRLSGGEARLRGGQGAVLDTGVTGCLYGMIDVDGGLGVFTWNNMDTTVFGDLPGLNVLNTLSGTYRLAVNAIDTGGLAEISTTTATLPRRAIVPFAGNLMIFGSNGSGTMQDVYSVALASDETGTGQATILFSLTAPCDFLEVEEPTSSGTNRALYISTFDGTGTIYRYDGVTLTEEATGVGSERGILFLYAGEVYHASTNSIVARNSGEWDVSLVMPGGLVTWRPSDGVEHQDVAFVCGNDDGDSGQPKVLQIDGSTVTISFDPGGTTFGGAALESNGASAFFAFRLNTITDAIYEWDGATWEEFVTHGVEAQAIPGAMKMIGADLYWCTSTDDLNIEGTSHGYILKYPSAIAANETIMYESVEEIEPPPFDMNVL